MGNAIGNGIWNWVATGQGTMTVQAADFGDPADAVVLEAEMGELDRARGWLETLAQRDGWPERTLFRLQLGLEEALANVISYGFERDAGGAEISLAYARQAGMVQVRLIDNGIAFDPTAVVETETPSSIEDARIGGHGVRLMRRMLDEFSYCQVNGNNQLILGARAA